MTSGGRDVLSGAVLLLASIGLLIAIPGQIETIEGPDLTPAFIPRVMAFAIAGLSVILLVQGARALYREGARGGGFSRSDFARGAGHVLGVAAVIAIHAALLTQLGYIATTALAVVALALLYGHRKWWHIALLAAIAPPAILFFFRYTMLVLLPGGVWFE